MEPGPATRTIIWRSSGAAGGELEISAADEIEAAGILALGEERGLRGQRDGAGGQLKIGQNGAAQRAEPAGTAIGASRATEPESACTACFCRVCGFLPKL